MTDIYTIAERFRQHLLDGEQSASRDVAQAYLLAYRRIQPQIESLIKHIRMARLTGGIVNVAWLVERRDRLAALEEQIVREMTRFAPEAASIVSRTQVSFITDAANDQHELIRAGARGRDLRITPRPGARLASGAVEALVGFASDGSPLTDLFRALGPSAAKKVREQLIVGVTLGWHPDKMARSVRDAFGGDLGRALTITRTESLRAYREASRQTYVENADVLDGWVWRCARSARTCALCWAMDGTEHGPEEILASHPNCRCVMIPMVKGSDMKIERGTDAFKKLPAEDQEAVLGPAKYEAYKAGNLKLAHLVGERTDPRWGLVRYERPLKETMRGAPKIGNSGGKPPRGQIRRRPGRDRAPLVSAQRGASLPKLKPILA